MDMSGSESDEEAKPCFGQKTLFPDPVTPSDMAGSGRIGLKRSFPEPVTGSEVTEKLMKGSSYSDMSVKMMAKMGYKAGTGLGKHKQGRVEIIEASHQRGRRGLGLSIAGFDAEHIEWNFEDDEVIIDEVVKWLPLQTEPSPSLDVLQSWKQIGDKKRTIADETTFCDEKTLQAVLKSKSVFDRLEPEELRRARTRSNPYETIRGVFFLNRAAMKMANIDAVLDFMLTAPRDKHGRSLIGPNDLLYFADVCAGPGGFSEYVLWRTKGEAKGFGMTLKGSCDFKLEDFFAGPSEMFEPHYGVGGLEGDGDVFNPANQEAFIKFVMDSTDGKGVHFMMCDGGFSVEGQENIQEILSKQLYLCQFLMALSILRVGGHFVCKLFDLFTPFSVGLIYLMYRAFDNVSIFKPVTSRPANSERYIICKGLRPDSEPIRQYFHELNLDLNKYMVQTSLRDVNEIVSPDVLNDPVFCDYIMDSNEELAVIQIRNLMKIRAFAQSTDLYELRQLDTRKSCLEKWKIPDKVRTAPSKDKPENKFKDLLKSDDLDSFSHSSTELTPASLDNVHSLYDYKCVVSGNKDSIYILGMGRTHTFCWDGRTKSKWQKLQGVQFGIQLELPPDTLVEAEICAEFKGEGKGQRRLTSVHIIDGFYVCGVDIQHLSYPERIAKLQKLVKAITKPTRHTSPIKLPEVVRFEEINKIFDRLSMRAVKGSGGNRRLCYTMDDGHHFMPSGIRFMKFIKHPWTIAFSQRSRRKYFYNVLTKSSVFDMPIDALSSTRESKRDSLHWIWENGVVLLPDQEVTQDDHKLSRQHILNFLTLKLGHR